LKEASVAIARYTTIAVNPPITSSNPNQWKMPMLSGVGSSTRSIGPPFNTAVM
jgi:hypothetical protein